jgi:hypothetical protein
VLRPRLSHRESSADHQPWCSRPHAPRPLIKLHAATALVVTDERPSQGHETNSSAPANN